jgi:coenzyme PQQ synthesis protein D (PqqD)
MADGDAEILSARVRVPEHVVYRDFADETVILNLDSGKYHGLNRTAARMVETLDSAASVRSAVDSLAAEFEQPREVVERDVLALCRSLEERGLIARHAGDAG